MDPLTSKFPFLSAYQFAGNKPIWSREIEGLESEVDAKEIADEEPLQVDPGDEHKIDQRSETSCFGDWDWSFSDLTLYTSSEFTTKSDCVYSFPSSNSTLKEGHTGWQKSDDATLALKSLILVGEGELGASIGSYFKLVENALRYAGFATGLMIDASYGDIIVQEEIIYKYREQITWYGTVQYDQRTDQVVAVDYYGHKTSSVVVSAVLVQRIINEKTGEVLFISSEYEVPIVASEPNQESLLTPLPLKDYGTIEEDR